MARGYIDPTRCIASVYEETGWGSRQCRFKRKSGEYCHIHDPETVRERREKAHARFAASRQTTPRYSRVGVAALVERRLRCRGYHMTAHAESYTCIEWNRGKSATGALEELCDRCQLITDMSTPEF